MSLLALALALHWLSRILHKGKNIIELKAYLSAQISAAACDAPHFSPEVYPRAANRIKKVPYRYIRGIHMMRSWLDTQHVGFYSVMK